MSDLSPQASTKVDGSDIQRADWEIAIIRYSRTSLDKEKAKQYLIDVCGAKFRDLDAITFCRAAVNALILEGFDQDDIDMMKWGMNRFLLFLAAFGVCFMMRDIANELVPDFACCMMNFYGSLLCDFVYNVL